MQPAPSRPHGNCGWALRNCLAGTYLDLCSHGRSTRLRALACQALLVLALSFRQCAAQGDYPVCRFPYFSCESVVENPPFTLDPVAWTSTTQPDGSSRYCVTLIKTHVAEATVPSHCGPADAGGSRLKSIAIATSRDCQQAIRNITFMGRPLQRTTHNYQQCGAVTTEVAFGNKSLGTYAELPTRVPLCFTLGDGKCSDFSGFAGQPTMEFALISDSSRCCPIVPVSQQNARPLLQPAQATSTSSAFPYTTCRNFGAEPYQFVNGTAASTAKGNQYCWSLSIQEAPSMQCGSFDLRKIEIDVDPACDGAVAELSFNGQQLAPTFQLFAKQGTGSVHKHAVLKVVPGLSILRRLGLLAHLSTQHAAQLCVTLKPGACSTLASFCPGGKCAVAFSNAAESCCSRGLPLQLLQHAAETATASAETATAKL